MKQRITFSLEKRLVERFQEVMVLSGATNKSTFLEYILREKLYNPEDLIRRKIRLLAQQINMLQNTLKAIEDQKK